MSTEHDPLLLEAVLLSALQTPCGITGATARARSRTPHPLRALDSDVTVRHALHRYHREGWIHSADRGTRYTLTSLGEQRLLWHEQCNRVSAQDGMTSGGPSSRASAVTKSPELYDVLMV